MRKKTFSEIIIALIILTPAMIISYNMDSFSVGFRSFLIFVFMISILLIIFLPRDKSGDKTND